MAAAYDHAAEIAGRHSNQVLKMDVTTLDAGERDQYLLMVNFNIPVSVMQEDRPLTLDQVLTNVGDFLYWQFVPEPVFYQVTASYTLRHRHTGDERLFTGSFCPKTNNISSLSGSVFRFFSLDTFNREVKQFTTPQNIIACLEWPSDDDSDWSFDSLSSVIINCQVKVGQYHKFIVRRDLLLTRGTRRGRRHVTFLHPWG